MTATTSGRCPYSGCTADAYPHDPDDYGHANPCGCDWTFTCADHADDLPPCGELLYTGTGAEPGPAVAVCIQPYGTGHSHNDATPAEAIATGTAVRIEPLPDHDAAQLAADITARLDPLDGPGFELCPPTLPAFYYVDLRAMADADRAERRTWRDDGDIALDAALFGLVPTPPRVGAVIPSARQRTAELVDVWSGWVFMADADRRDRYAPALDAYPHDRRRGETVSRFDGYEERHRQVHGAEPHPIEAAALR